MTGVTIDVASGSPPTAQLQQTRQAAKSTLAHRPSNWRQQGSRRRTGYRPAA